MKSTRRADAAALSDADWRAIMACPLFGSLDSDKARRLVGGRRPTEIAPRQTIFMQGQRSDAFYVVLDGWVKLFRVTPAGEEATVGVFTRGDSFAEPVAFLGGLYPANAEAASACRLLKIDAAGFDAAMANDPSLATAMLASVVSHTERLAREIVSLKLQGAPRRVAAFLVALTDRREGAATIVLPHDKALLAGRLGVTPESLSRAFAAMRKIGVAVQRERVSIADVAALRAFAAESGRRSGQKGA